MVSRLSALIVWALVAGSCVFWGLRLFAQPAKSLPRSVASSDPMSAQGDWSRLMGSAPVSVTEAPTEALAPEISARFRLAGVMAPKRPSEQGLAVISVDGNPARVYRVGAAIDGDLVLREVSLRSATVASARSDNDAAGAFVLEMPAVTAAATGALPPALSFTAPDGVAPSGRAPRGAPAR